MSPSFDRPLRVIQWTTGNIGRRSLHAILGRPDMELVGVYDDATANRIRELQTQAGVPSTGVVDTVTWQLVRTRICGTYDV